MEGSCEGGPERGWAIARVGEKWGRELQGVGPHLAGVHGNDAYDVLIGQELKEPIGGENNKGVVEGEGAGGHGRLGGQHGGVEGFRNAEAGDEGLPIEVMGLEVQVPEAAP